MFTGIIHHTGRIVTREHTPQGLRFCIETQFQDLLLGESIAVDGVCLTVTAIKNNLFYCDVSPETISLTAMKSYIVGSIVNLERSLAVGDRMGGHYVTGHVDRTAYIAALEQQDDYLDIEFRGFNQQQLNYLVPKGSVTINGVSLTINRVLNESDVRFSVMLIPHTLDVTNLNELTQESMVNIEFDYYAKIIAHQLALQTSAKKEAVYA